MHLYLKSTGLLLTTLLSLNLLPLPIAAQPATAAAVFAETTATQKLLESAKQHYRRAEFKQAIALYQQVLTQAQQSGDRSNQIEALLQLGDIDFWIGNVTQAEAKFQQALKLARETKDRTREGSALALLSAVSRNRQDYTQTNERLKESLAIAQQTKDQKLEARSRFFMGIVLHLQQQYPQALETLQQALKLDQQLQNTDEIAHIEDWLAITYLRLKDLKQAELTIQQQQKLSQDTGYGLAEYDGLNTIASLQQERKQPDQVLQTYQKQLEMAQSANNLWFQRDSLIRIGDAYSAQKQPKEAIAAYQKALRLAQQVDDRLAQANVYSSIGNLFRQSGQYPEAQQAFQLALVLYQAELSDAQKTSARVLEGTIQFQIGSNYFAQARLSYLQKHYQSAIELSTKALRSLEQAAIINKESKNLSFDKITGRLRARSYEMITLSYIELKQYDLALAANQKQQAIAKEIGNSEEEQQALEDAFNIYASQSNSVVDPTQYDKKLAFNQRLISLAQTLKAPETGIPYLLDNGQIYAFQGRLSEALEVYQQVLSHARTVQDTQHEFFALIGIGRLYGDQGNYLQAIAINTQALQISRQPKFKRRDPTSESLALNNLGVNYKQQGQYAQALSYFQQANEVKQNYYGLFAKGETLEAFRAICRQEYDPSDVSTQYDSDVGEYCTRPIKSPTGLVLKQFQDLIALNAEGARQSISTQLNNIGGVYADQGELQKALLFQQKSLAIAREQNDHLKEATCLNNIGTTYRDLGDYPKAIAFVQQALKIAVEQGDRAGEVVIRRNFGVIKSDVGRYTEASSEYQQSLKLARQFKQRQEESNVLYSIAYDQSAQGKYAEAISTFEQAIKIQQEINIPARVILSLGKLGDTYAQLGQYAKAVELHQQALSLARKIGARQFEATTLSFLGEDDRLQGKFASALTYQQQALSIAQSIQARLTESKALQRIGRVYTQRSQPQKALPVLQQALTIARETGRKPDEASILAALGQPQLQLGKFSEAQSSLQQAIVLARETGDAPSEAQALNNLGQLFTKQNQPELAIVFYKQSVKLTEDIRKGLRTLPKDQQQSYTETVADTYRQLADLLLKRDRVLEAQQVLDLLKVQELDDYLKNVRGETPPLVFLKPEEELLKKFNALQQGAIAALQELNTLTALPENQLTASQRQRLHELEQLQEALNAQLNQFVTRPDIQALTDVLRQQDSGTITPTELEQYSHQLQNKLVGLKNTALLYPLILDDRLELVLVTAEGSIRRTVNVKREALNSAIAQFAQALKNPNCDAKPSAQTLYTWLIKPLEADLTQAHIQTIIYAPDRRLRYVPLAALHDGKQWLIQRYRTQYITAVSLNDLTTIPQPLHILAGAISADRQRRYQVQTTDTPLTFTGLPFAAKEVATIAQQIPNTTTFLDKAFNLAAIKERFRRYSVIHFATHGYFDRRNPDNSFILFDDTAASLRQIHNWSLNADLVVLSACETGLADDQLGSRKTPGEGAEVMGLGYQFQQAGARATIASLWSVDDGGTQVLMDNFYANLQAGKTKAEALRQAQMALISGQAQSSGSNRSTTLVARWQGQLPAKVINQLNHPYYWAPFILIGNGL